MLGRESHGKSGILDHLMENTKVENNWSKYQPGGKILAKDDFLQQHFNIETTHQKYQNLKLAFKIRVRQVSVNIESQIQSIYKLKSTLLDREVQNTDGLNF